MDKFERAEELADAGGTNAEIVDKLSQEFGSGVSTTVLAKIRASKPSRVAKEAADLRTIKRAFCRELLLAGNSGYAIKKACKEKFGSGLGHEIIQSVQAELAEELSLIEKIDLPEEMLEPETALVTTEQPQPSLAVTAPHGPNGTLDSMKAIQRWMMDNNAKSLHLTLDGKLSVLARHEFNIGEL